MKKLFILIVCFFVLSASVVYANQVSHKKLTEELLGALKIDDSMDVMFDQMQKMQEMQMKQSIPPGATEEQVKLVEEYTKKVTRLMKEELSYKKLKDDYVKLYMEVFTEEDIKGLIKFYKSPIGAKYVDKTPELTQKGMEVGQKATTKLMPKVMDLTREMINKAMKLESEKLKLEAEKQN